MDLQSHSSKSPKTKMLQNTTQKEQAMGSGDAHMGLPPNHDLSVFRTGEEATGEEWTTVDGEDEILADDTQGDHSTVSTECSHDKGVFSSRPSPLLGAETDPTSLPSVTLEDLDLERKCTMSRLNSIEAVYGSDSVHSEQSDPSSTGYSDSKESVPIAVNPGKAKDIGVHFGESSMNTSTSRFHDPTNSWEAQHINKKIRQAHDTLDEINRHPEEHLRNHGSSYQLSARPKEPSELTLSEEDKIAHKPTVHVPPDSSLHVDTEEGCIIGRPRKQRSACCTIM